MADTPENITILVVLGSDIPYATESDVKSYA